MALAAAVLDASVIVHSYGGASDSQAQVLAERLSLRADLANARPADSR